MLCCAAPSWPCTALPQNTRTIDYQISPKKKNDVLLLYQAGSLVTDIRMRGCQDSSTGGQLGALSLIELLCYFFPPQQKVSS